MKIEIKFNLLLSIIQKEFQITKDDILSKSRKRDINDMKSIIVYTLRIIEGEKIDNIIELLDIAYHDCLYLTNKYSKVIKDSEFRHRADTVTRIFKERKESRENSEKKQRKYYIQNPRTHEGYELSTNYKKLWDTIRKGYTIPVWTLQLYWKLEALSWDKKQEKTSIYDISTLDNFEEFCQQVSLHFIIPKF